MSRKPWAIHRQDSTRKARLEEAAALGWRNVKVDGVFDDILWHPDRVAIYCIEWKGPRTPVTKQQADLEVHGFPLHFVETAQQLQKLLALGGKR